MESTFEIISKKLVTYEVMSVCGFTFVESVCACSTAQILFIQFVGTIVDRQKTIDRRSI